MERVGDLFLGHLHHPHPMLISQICVRMRDLTTNCSCNYHLKIFVHTPGIPVRNSLNFLQIFLSSFIPVIVATKYLLHPGFMKLVEFGHSQVFLQIEVLLIFSPVAYEPRNVLEDHHMRRTNFLGLSQLTFEPGLVRFVFTDYVSRVGIKLRVQYEEGDTVLVK